MNQHVTELTVEPGRVESGGAGMLSKKLVSAPRTPDLLREAEFAMLWPSNLRSYH